MSRKYIPNSRQQERFKRCNERWRRVKHQTGVSSTQFFRCCLSKPRTYGSIFRISPMPPCGVYEADDGSPEVVWADAWVESVRLDNGNEYDSVTVTWVVGPGNITVPLFDPFKRHVVTHYAHTQTHSTGVLATTSDAKAWFQGVISTYETALNNEIAARTP